MSKRTTRWLSASLSAGALVVTAYAAQAQDKELVFGLQCDRTGPTQTVGVYLCPGYHDYIDLVNSKGGIEGYKIRALEIDIEYKVPPAMEAHERFKKEGEVLEGVYGTPQIAALTKKLEEDKILGTSPGFGTSAAADGRRYPYVFPIAASYWSQGAAALAFAKKELGGSLKRQSRRTTRDCDAPAASGRTNHPSLRVLAPRSFMLCGSNLALSNGELIEEERPQERHCLFSVLAVPECMHVGFAFPQSDGVPSVRIALVSREPLVLEALHIAPE
jgi:branched-chain amino acid transport system substrate-binding protein